MKTSIHKDNHGVAEAFAAFFADWLDGQKRPWVTVALSGGSTPTALFRHWAQDYRDKIAWEKIHFFWGDERCVPPDNPESNFGMTHELLFDHISIPAGNIHRVRGEEPPEQEAGRYGREIEQWTDVENDRPIFDLVILGMGADGHTASIFPDQMELLTDPAICAVATHPESGQKRITLTGPVINAARLVVFLVTGAAKAPIVRQILEKNGDYESYPAAHIKRQKSTAVWFLDEAAAGTVL